MDGVAVIQREVYGIYSSPPFETALPYLPTYLCVNSNSISTYPTLHTSLHAIYEEQRNIDTSLMASQVFGCG